ncbi:MAG: ribose 5-phosphate isomerase B [Alphaproteobacteria bacterium]|nr:ribose 5-phosphate isomerase B [Alphaproteobacteria bacterium]
MKLAIASDHGGFALKQDILQHYAQYQWLDLGTYSEESVDYPDYAQKMADAIRSKQAELGILVCGTGIGISIAANRCKGIRAALLYSVEAARLAKEHNNANVLVFGGRTMKPADVFSFIDAFMAAEFAGERHQRRLDKIETVE